MRKTLPFLLSFFAAAPAWALPLDIVNLAGLGTYRVNDSSTDEAVTRFRLLTSELAFALSPRTMAPAQTLGTTGFEIAYDTSVVAFNTGQEYWQIPTQGRRDNNVAPTSPQAVAGLHVRKGLPFSFEVEGHLTYLFASSMMMVGGDLRYSFLEGYKYVPNLAVRAGAGRLLNSGDIDMTTINLDVTLSKSFPVGGVMTITPVVGWGMLFMNTNSGVLDATPDQPGDNASIESQSGGSLYTFPQQDLGSNFLQRVSAGLQFQSWIFSFMYQFDGGFIRSGPFIHTHTFKVALDF